MVYAIEVIKVVANIVGKLFLVNPGDILLGGDTNNNEPKERLGSFAKIGLVTIAKYRKMS